MNQRYCSNCKSQARQQYKEQWYAKHRERVIDRVQQRYRANPEKVKERVRKWEKEHPEDPHQKAARLRSWRKRNPEKSKEQDRRAYEARQAKYPYPRVSDEILRLCREDPRRAVGIGSLAGPEFSVCLECGEKHPAVGQHVARRHMPLIEYRRKWGYAKNSPLASQKSIQAKASAGRRFIKAHPHHLIPPKVNQLNASAGRREWAGAKQKRLNLRDAHNRRIEKGLWPQFKKKTKVTSPAKKRPGRPITKQETYVQAKAMHDAGLSWAKITLKLDPAGYSKDRYTAVHRIRIGVGRLKKTKK